MRINPPQLFPIRSSSGTFGMTPHPGLSTTINRIPNLAASGSTHQRLASSVLGSRSGQRIYLEEQRTIGYMR
jgi:hypothetical protein